MHSSVQDTRQIVFFQFFVSHMLWSVCVPDLIQHFLPLLEEE